MNPKELAAAIRRGHGMIGEDSRVFYRSDCGCALGTALAGIGIPAPNLFQEHQFASVEKCAALLGVSTDLAGKVSRLHYSNEMQRLEIADWLDTLPDETPMPAKVERETDADYATRMVAQITETVPA